MALPTHRQLIQAVKASGADTNIPPIAFQFSLLDGVDPNSDEALLTPCAVIEPIPHPVLTAFLETNGAARRGRVSWSMGMGDDYSADALRVLRDRMAPGTVFAEHRTFTPQGPRNLHDIGYLNTLNDLTQLFRGTKAAGLFGNNQRGGHDVANRLNQPLPRDYRGYGGVTLSTTNDNRVTWIKVFTHNIVVPDWLPEAKLNLYRAGRTADNPTPMLVTHAIAILEWLSSEQLDIIDPTVGEGNVLATLRRRVANTVIAYPTRGKPAYAEISVGQLVADNLQGIEVKKAEKAEAATRGTVLSESLMATLRRTNFDGAVVHPATADMGMIAIAEPFIDEDLFPDNPDMVLRPYQQEAVGRHVASKVGFLNACSPGMGKTIMTLVGMQQRSLTRPGYRAVVVTEANVRTQWIGEIEKWFPQARTFKVSGGKDAEKLAAALEEAGEEPLVIVMSYSALKSVHDEHKARTEVVEEVVEADDEQTLFNAVEALVGLSQKEEETPVVEEDPTEPAPAAVSVGSLLLDTYLHDLIADEAEVLRGTGRQAYALWELRKNSEVAIPLTGTPINKGIDDMGRLIAWARGDERLFYGIKLSDQFDLSSADSLKELNEAMGAAIFRRDTSEIEDELPVIEPVVLKLKPSAAEKALATAARMELKRVYNELVEAVEQASLLDPENEAYTQARDVLKAARGAWLGGTTLARMASSDPAALVNSTSAGAALLAGQGLIEAATQKTGTKRAAVVEEVARRIMEGEAVLIFTEFATVATGLIADLEAAGVKVGGVLGGDVNKRDRMVAAFQTGDLDVLVCTSSGERGINLQRATTLVHYDLPWTPKGVIQRTGRARRLSSENNILHIIFPLMEGTIEEDVAALVVTRAVEAMQTLDASRGVDTTRTEMGMALGGLVGALDNTATGRSQGNALLEVTRQLVGD